MRKIIVMNAKGGCGKTTVATNLASLYAAHDYKTALLDYDPQGSSSAWLKRRSEVVAAIHGIVAYQSSGWNSTRSWQMRMPHEIERVIVDTPAAIKSIDVPGYLKDVDTIVVPVLSSVIDVEASIPFIREIMRVIKMRSSQAELVVVANRVRVRTDDLQMMAEICADIEVPLVGHLRDSVNYLRCTDIGLGVHDLPIGRATLERRALTELVTAIDTDFEHMLLAGGNRQNGVDAMGKIALSIPLQA
ncbi:MAG: ParA family protein [Gammaproteobacteria bacterium]|nr:ParA family protein [Gammaproteobacteria bacterium]